MNVSSNYILMCEKSSEIQSLYKPDCLFKNVVCWKTSLVVVGGYVSPKLDSSVIWIPRQDQLQEMVKKDNWSQPLLDLYAFLNQGTNSVKRVPEDGIDKSWIMSMEQLWLVFVMYKKYGKVWNSEKKDWIKGEIKNV